MATLEFNSPSADTAASALARAQLLLVAQKLHTAEALMQHSADEAAVMAQRGASELSIWSDLADRAIAALLQRLIVLGLPAQSKTNVRSTIFPLGGTGQPVDGTWAETCQWAIAIVIIFSVLCAAFVLMVVICICVERNKERRRRREAKQRLLDAAPERYDSDGDDDDDDDDSHGSARGNVLVDSRSASRSRHSQRSSSAARHRRRRSPSPSSSSSSGSDSSDQTSLSSDALPIGQRSAAEEPSSSSSGAAAHTHYTIHYTVASPWSPVGHPHPSMPLSPPYHHHHYHPSGGWPHPHASARASAVPPPAWTPSRRG
ncbi:hypothetical protein NESM_000854500 [Novymonas esmeraldas]|uniref:Transmembrane protein n=1 Tax=Novymonas esmeraldas TaxID=1808958 RepID=A0AAW0EX07_9TRYP